ncbi:hypothetical protein [Furfurilactobacillus siliginis]|uniref:Uncharacterized protein n=1 Tax=Furfurilactobacillus siliginis TaxID=348151 RepID=A0A0R2L360_9LACO|nr:hypothetical protein [Furfurilactobacillus siliginis]KRN93245.1 hypothetical protein IV55_GL001068 [Furfurilactobacillus siliginis]GEK29639.1 hypothetical protein LSI01_19500 [Furfurilactobacillus siliginis]
MDIFSTDVPRAHQLRRYQRDVYRAVTLAKEHGDVRLHQVVMTGSVDNVVNMGDFPFRKDVSPSNAQGGINK